MVGDIKHKENEKERERNVGRQSGSKGTKNDVSGGCGLLRSGEKEGQEQSRNLLNGMHP